MSNFGEGLRADFGVPFYQQPGNKAPAGRNDTIYPPPGSPVPRVPPPTTVDPITEDPLPEPISPSVSQRPPIRTTGASVLNIEVLEGIRTVAGDFQIESTGPINPTTIDNGDSGDGEWVAPARAKANDNSTTTCSTTGSGFTSQLRASGFGFTLPEGAIIVGLQVVVRRSKT